MVVASTEASFQEKSELAQINSRPSRVSVKWTSPASTRRNISRRLRRNNKLATSGVKRVAAAWHPSHQVAVGGRGSRSVKNRLLSIVISIVLVIRFVFTKPPECPQGLSREPGLLVAAPAAGGLEFAQFVSPSAFGSERHDYRRGAAESN